MRKDVVIGGVTFEVQAGNGHRLVFAHVGTIESTFDVIDNGYKLDFAFVFLLHSHQGGIGQVQEGRPYRVGGIRVAVIHLIGSCDIDNR